MPYFTHKKMVQWISDAGVQLGFQVQTERRSKTKGKTFQIDSTWSKDGKVAAFVEAEHRWETNHIIGHLTCCSVYAQQENIKPKFILVYLENRGQLSKRLSSTWRWLREFLPDTLEVKALPIHVSKEKDQDGLHASNITKEDFSKELNHLMNST